MCHDVVTVGVALATCVLLRCETGSVALGVLGAALLVLLLVLYRQPRNDVTGLSFAVSFLILIDCESILKNFGSIFIYIYYVPKLFYNRKLEKPLRVREKAILDIYATFFC